MIFHYQILYYRIKIIRCYIKLKYRIFQSETESIDQIDPECIISTGMTAGNKYFCYSGLCQSVETKHLSIDRFLAFMRMYFSGESCCCC